MQIQCFCRVSLAVALLAALAAPARAVNIYNEDFNIPAESTPHGLDSVGWDFAFQNGGTVTDGDETEDDGNIKVTGTDRFLFFVGSFPETFAYADDTTGDFTPTPYLDLDPVVFDLRNNSNGTEQVHLALKLNGDWYVSDTFYHEDETDFTEITVDPFTDTTWSELNFDIAGDQLGIGSSASLPGSGTIEGVGFYTPMVNVRIRIDNVSVGVTPVPEPTAIGLALLGAAGGLALVVARRRWRV